MLAQVLAGLYSRQRVKFNGIVAAETVKGKYSLMFQGFSFYWKSKDDLRGLRILLPASRACCCLTLRASIASDLIAIL
jgi:hypothetical protein